MAKDKGIFETLMFADTPDKITAKCARHFTTKSFNTMLETHMKYDENLYHNQDVIKNDHDAEIYRLAYTEGYQAGWKRCITSASKAWEMDMKERNNGFKFGDF